MMFDNKKVADLAAAFSALQADHAKVVAEVAELKKESDSRSLRARAICDCLHVATDALGAIAIGPVEKAPQKASAALRVIEEIVERINKQLKEGKQP